jgi:pyridoxal biosynthesis lyase PdxS
MPARGRGGHRQHHRGGAPPAADPEADPRAVGHAVRRAHAPQRELRAPFHLVEFVAQHGKCLPVPNFAAGGVATPADAALVMALGAEAVFVGSGIFKSESPQKTASPRS